MSDTPSREVPTFNAVNSRTVDPRALAAGPGNVVEMENDLQSAVNAAESSFGFGECILAFVGDLANMTQIHRHLRLEEPQLASQRERSLPHHAQRVVQQKLLNMRLKIWVQRCSSSVN